MVTAAELHHEPEVVVVVTSRGPDGRVWSVAHVCRTCGRLVTGGGSPRHASTYPFEVERYASLNPEGVS